MNAFRPRVTRNRVVGGIAVFVVASAVLIPLGVEPIPFLFGAVVGLILVGLVVATMARRQRHQEQRETHSEAPKPAR